MEVYELVAVVGSSSGESSVLVSPSFQFRPCLTTPRCNSRSETLRCWLTLFLQVGADLSDTGSASDVGRQLERMSGRSYWRSHHGGCPRAAIWRWTIPGRPLDDLDVAREPHTA